MKSWDEIKNQPERLANMVNELGTRETGKQFGKNKDTVNNALKKYGYEYDIQEQKWVKQEKMETNDFEQLLNKIAGSSINIEIRDNVYCIQKGSEEVIIDKQKLKSIYYDYCEMNLTQEETAIKNDLILDDFKIIKQAFDIIHDSLPLTNEEILHNSAEDNIEEILKNKKRKIKEKKPIEELRYLRGIAEKYYTKYFQAERILEEVNVEPITYEKSETYLHVEDTKDRIMIVTLADLHYGKQVLSKKVIGVDEDYNVKTLKDRLSYYKDQIVDRILLYKPEKLYIVNLGDVTDDPLSNTYPNQIHHQEVVGEQQILGCTKLLSQFILDLYQYQNNIKSIFLPGNHGHDVVNPDILIGGIMEQLLEKYDDITVDSIKRYYKLEKILNHNFIFSHGNFLSKSDNKRETEILNIINSLRLQGNTYLFTGHEHHEHESGTGFEHKKLPSIVGSDFYSAEKLNVNSRPSQMFFIVDKTGLSGRYKVYFD